VETIKNLGQRKPGKKGLREHITQSLENSPLANSSSSFDDQADE
jgi:hypothetical protein